MSRRLYVSRVLTLLSALSGGLQGCVRLPDPEHYEPPGRDAAVLTQALDTIQERSEQPAIGAAVLRGAGDPVAAVVGSLVIGGAQPAALHHRFHLGSVTKSFTALLVVQLVEAGALSYDTTLAGLFPGLELHPDYRRVTIHDLMMNRAGLIPWQQLQLEDPVHVTMLSEIIPAQAQDPVEQRRLVATYALSQPPRFEPGSQGEYSNVGWAVLGHALEHRTGVPFEQLLAERIFEPLGMSSARVGGWPAGPQEPDQPRGHLVDTDGAHPQALDDPYQLEPWMNPSGGIHCSIGDLALYAQEILRGLQGQGALLDLQAYDQMHTVHAEERVSRFYQGARGRQAVTLGYGWGVSEIDHERISVADGSAGTFYARVVVLPALDVAFVGFTNAGSGEPALSEAYRASTGLPW